MAHYAFLDEDNIVTQVIVGKDVSDDADWEVVYATEVGQVCRRTDCDTVGGQHSAGGVPFRKNYAGIGFSYDAERDAFIPPRPGDDCVLDEQSCLWVPLAT